MLYEKKHLPQQQMSYLLSDTYYSIVVDGSADTVDELISTSTALATFYTSPFVCEL